MVDKRIPNSTAKVRAGLSPLSSGICLVSNVTTTAVCYTIHTFARDKIPQNIMVQDF